MSLLDLQMPVRGRRLKIRLMTHEREVTRTLVRFPADVKNFTFHIPTSFRTKQKYADMS